MSEAAEFASKIPILSGEDFLADTITPLEELKERAVSEMKCKMELFVTHLQCLVVRGFEQYEDGKKFFVDRWHRKEGGGGITTVLHDGKVFEKAGVNISVVYGEMHEDQIKSMKSRGKDVSLEGKNTFFATGISCVIHPVNPYIPTMHFNYRYFEVVNQASGNSLWWFGGGIDMTPNYLIEQDAKYFHSVQKEACEKHNPSYYPRFKKWADEYFYNKHRNEHRGIGGTFFDDLDDGSPDQCFSFVVTCGYAVLPSYTKLIDEHIDDPFTEKQRDWQLVRRGRYVEYNLVYDRGTKFGLATPGARIESILISMPLVARWEYMYPVEEGSEEEKMMQVLKKARDWV